MRHQGGARPIARNPPRLEGLTFHEHGRTMPRSATTVFGGVDVMLGQLDRLLAVMTLPRVSLGIIPPTVVRRLWPGEGFWIFDDQLVKIETTSAGIKVTQPREIALFEKAFGILQDHAVYGREARGLITQAMIDLQHL